jgi:hypothetical protein
MREAAVLLFPVPRVVAREALHQAIMGEHLELHHCLIGSHEAVVAARASLDSESGGNTHTVRKHTHKQCVQGETHSDC